mmetsp:Transcript_76662/g.185527  ORF Transcript_76662/g.185527 Transcript_76662/m.185527 type:complete len:208 (+) Transcript_76662:3-626(+)
MLPRVQDCHEHIKNEKDAQRQRHVLLEQRVKDLERVVGAMPLAQEPVQARPQGEAAAEQSLLARVEAIVEEAVSRRAGELLAARARSPELHAEMERRVQHVEKIVRDSAVVLDAAYKRLQECQPRASPEKTGEQDANESLQQESSGILETAGYRQVEGRLRRLQSKLAKAPGERGAPESAALEGQLLDQFVTMPASEAARIFTEHRS